MNVWIVNPFDDIPGEGKAQRYWTLADTLSKQGHQVVWWSSNWSHRRKAQRHVDVSHESNHQAFVLKLVRTSPYYKNISARRVWNHIRFGRHLYRDACLAVERGELVSPDIVLASMPPMEGTAAAFKLRARFGCKVVTDIMDVWPQTLLQAVLKHRVRGSFTYKLLEHAGRIALYPYWRMLRRACAESDAISAQSYAFADYAKENGATGEVHVCYLGAEGDTGVVDSPNGGMPSTTCGLKGEDPEVMGARSCSNSIDDPQLLAKKQETHTLRLLYLGAMGASYDLHTLLDAVRMLNETKLDSNIRSQPGKCVQVECVLVGDGEKRAELEAMNVSGVRFTGFLNGAELIHELKAADLGIIPFFSESGVSVPYKAGDYLAHGIPILSTIDGELGDKIREFECGSVYRSNDVGSLVRSIERFIDQAELLVQAKENAKACFFNAFDRQKLYPNFASWIYDQCRLDS